MRARGAILDRLGHRVRLLPDVLRAQAPAVGLQSECEPPGDADEVFVREPLDAAGTRGIGALDRGLLASPLRVAVPARVEAGVWVAALLARVAVTDVQPERPVVAEHSVHLTEDG